MSADEKAIRDALDAISDDHPFDWEQAESRSPDASARETVRKLRLVATIARVLQQSPLGAEPRPLPDPPFDWGPLRVLEVIGRGASGRVYRARDPRLDRPVALKLFALDRPGSREIEAGVIREGRLLARVRHQNVVTVHGADERDGYIGIWMELVEGRTLEAELGDRGRFEPGEIAGIGMEVCRALSAVHGAGLIHGDIKAQNVMREAGGRIVLMDFGAGRELHPGSRAVLAGTPLYLAPEILEGGPVTVQSDVYAVGVLLFHLSTSSYPIRGRSLVEIRAAHAEPRNTLIDARPDLPVALMGAIERAIEPGPDARFETPEQMELALAATVAGQPAVRAPTIWRLLAGSAAAAAVVMIGLLLWRSGRSESTPSTAAPAVRQIAMPPAFLVGRPSRDGRMLSYSGLDGNLAVLDLERLGSTRLTTDASFESGTYAEFSMVSPNGRSTVYGWTSGDRHELRIADVDGQRPRVLLAGPRLRTTMPFEWSADGRTILELLHDADDTRTLALVSASDGRVHPLKNLGRILPEHASLSPDGAWVAYDIPQTPSSAARDVYVMRSSGADDRRLIGHSGGDFAPVWTVDGKHLLFVSDRSGTLDLWSVGVADGSAEGAPQLWERSVGRMRLLGLTASGRYYHQRLIGAVDVYVADLDGGEAAPLVETFAGSNISSVWSTDGRRVAYASRRGALGVHGGSTALVLADRTGRMEREVVPHLADFLVRAWSTDGRRILVQGTDLRGRLGLYALEASDGWLEPVAVSAAGKSTPIVGRGDWSGEAGVIFVDSGRQALMVRESRSGPERVVLNFRTEQIEGLTGGNFGRGFKLSPDARQIAYSASIREAEGRATSLRVKTLGAGPSKELLRLRPPESLVLQDWLPDGSALLFTTYVRRPGDRPALWRWSFSTDKAHRLGLSMEGLRDVSADASSRRVTFTAGSPTLETWVIENLPAPATRR